MGASSGEPAVSVYAAIALLYVLLCIAWSAGALAVVARPFCGTWPRFSRAAGLAAIGAVLAIVLAIFASAVVDVLRPPIGTIAGLALVVFAAPHAFLAPVGLRRADGTRLGATRAVALAAVHAPLATMPQAAFVLWSAYGGL